MIEPFAVSAPQGAAFHSVERRGVRVVIDLRVGHIRELAVERDGRSISLLHTAPWVNESAALGAELAPNLRHLSGDFLCAPFGRNDIESGPSHGRSANSCWKFESLQEHPDGKGSTASYLLDLPIMGARVRKKLALRDGHSFLYVDHVFQGGAGQLPIASHAMIRFEGRGCLSWSPKRYGLTLRPPETDLARGKSLLRYPSRFSGDGIVQLAAGGQADLTDYPLSQAHEDIAVLVETSGQNLGWFSAVKHEERVVFLSLKSPNVWPTTVLWLSNGGRFYPPWNSRHKGVLGIEEARSYGTSGHRSSIEANDLSRDGIATALTLSDRGDVSVRYVIGGAPLPSGWARTETIRAFDGFLHVVAGQGRELQLPFDTQFLKNDG